MLQRKLDYHKIKNSYKNIYQHYIEEEPLGAYTNLTYLDK